MIKKLQNRYRSWQFWFESFFHLSLFLMLFDWGCPIPVSIGPLGFYEAALLGTGVCLLGYSFKTNFSFFHRFREILASAKALVVSFLAYVLYGIVTLLYGGNFSFGSSRYIVVGQMMVFSLYTFFYLFIKEKANSLARLKKIGWNISIAGLSVAVVAIVGYFTAWYTVFYQRISPIRDYNQYTTILLMATVVFSVLMINKRPLAFWKRYAVLGAYWLVMSTAIYTACSRRSHVLMCVFAAIFSVYALYMQERYHRKKHNRFVSFGVAVVSLALCFAVCLSVASATFKVVEKLAPVRLQNALSKIENGEEISSNDMESVSLVGEQYELSESFQGMVNGSGFSSREAIWNAAYDKIKNSDTRHLLFGYGSPYSWELYDDLSNPAVQPVRDRYHADDEKILWMNPHNFLLQDALDGGLIFVGIEMILIVCTFLYLLKLLYRTPHTAIPLILMNGILYVTLTLSSGHGMIAHKFLWLLIICQIAETYRIAKKKEMVS